MGSTDVPPPEASAPTWLVPASTALLGVGVLYWDATYILMTFRSLRTQSYGMPLLALAMNLSWEIVYVIYVCEAPLETLGFLVWLLLDLGLIYTAIRFGPREWLLPSSTSIVRRFIANHLPSLLTVLTVLCGIGHVAFARWWLAAPGRGYDAATGGWSVVMDKRGKWWGGREGFDTTELAFWSAGVAQAVLSVSSLGMLLARGHSGGTGYAIWYRTRRHRNAVKRPK